MTKLLVVEDLKQSYRKKFEEPGRKWTLQEFVSKELWKRRQGYVCSSFFTQMVKLIFYTILTKACHK